MRQLFLVFILCVINLPALQAQLQESFSDRNFTQDPVWVGDTEYFLVNSAGQLQSRGPAVTGTMLQLSTVSQAAAATQWEFYLHLGFATSSGNLAEVYLISDVPDLKSALQGYFVRIGGTEDEVSLYRKDGSVVTKIIDGVDRTIASSDNKLWVRVTRSATHDWTLELDATGTRQQYDTQGTVQDARYTTSSYAGILFRYSQANAQRFYFDDFTIQDIGAARLLGAVTINSSAVELTFSKPIQETDAANVANYQLNGNLRPVKADWQATAPQVVRLHFAQSFETGNNQIRVLRAMDETGNITTNLTGSFSFAPVARPGDVRVTEIYADINPSQGLPAAEFIEIYNRSDKTFNLQGWRYSDATSAAGVLPEYLLRPGAYLILCSVTDTADYRPFGATLGLITFPSLNDSGDDVEIFSPDGDLIDIVRYSSSWYRDPDKRNGGWSLELTDVNSRCTGALQWRASVHASGGTPGQANSVQEIDQEAPVLTQVVATGPDKIRLTFNEPLDSLQAVQAGGYSINLGMVVQQAKVLLPAMTEVELTLATPMLENARYAVSVPAQRDCAGNIGTPQQQTVVLPGTPQPGDVVINEILFNPRPGGVDFVEVVNTSGKYLNLQGWKLANRADGPVANAREISQHQFLLAPGEYLVLTANSAILQREYPQGRSDRYMAVPAMPAYPDDAGSVVLLLPTETIMDEVRYQSSQHFKLISDVEGVSLERISLKGPSTEANFYSAATPVKATPGYENSQAREDGVSHNRLTLQPKIFTPDGDGVDDALLLQFRLPQAGFMASVSIYDAQGRFIRKLSGNTLLGAESVLQWDGLTEGGAKAAIGYYVVLVELFNLQGQKEVLKQTAVVGGRF